MGDKIDTPQRPTDERQVVRGIDKDGKLIFDQVGIEELNYRGRFGALATSGTERDISIGEHIFVLNQADDENLFRIGDDVLVTPTPSHGGCCMWAEVIAKDTDVEPCRVTVHVEDISNIVGTFNNWELQVVARPKFGITKDTSTSSVDPTGDGPFTFTVTAGKFFPIGGKLLMIPLADRSIALVGLVKAYSGATLIVEKNSTNAIFPTSYTSWAVALLDAPQNAILPYEIHGLRINTNVVDPINGISISPGSIRDFTDTVDLILPSIHGRQLDAAWVDADSGGGAYVSANLTGTISSVGAAVTGLGTQFGIDFNGRLLDYTAQVDFLNVAKGASYPVFFHSIITSGGVVSDIVYTFHTSATTSNNLGVTGATYKRGGVASGANPLTYAIVLARNDADGDCRVFAVAFRNVDDGPDLPAGYTYYRVLGKVVWNGVTALGVFQPLNYAQSPIAAEIIDYTAADVLTKIKTVDGAGSGLDADLLDGQSSAFYATATGLSDHLADTSAAHAASAISYAGGTGMSATDVEAAIDELATEKLDATSYTAADVLTKIKTVDGAGSGLDADLLDGQSSAFYATATDLALKLDSSSYTAADVLTKIKTVDGAGSGLDADTLDGHDTSFFVAASAYTAADVLAKLVTVDGSGSGLDADLLDGNSSAFFATAASVSALPTLAGNTYTPTLTNVTNVAASTANVCTYSRVGSIVTVAGLVLVDPTTTLIATELGISLPIPSNFGTIVDCSGVGACPNPFEAAAIVADTVNDRASLQMITQTASNHSVRFTFQYVII